MQADGARAALPVDVAVGRAIARRRSALGLSQSKLASACGVSFQQVQKYETGANRISCSRLFQIAEVLRVVPADLFPVVSWDASADRSRETLSDVVLALSDAHSNLDRALKIAGARR